MFELRPLSNDRIKVLTLISYLIWEPRAWANTDLEKEDPILNSCQQFLATISLLYDDFNKQLTAENAIRNLKQGRQPVEDFIAEFQRWAIETEWNDVTLRNQFCLGLSEPLKDELARADLPPTLNDIIQRSITIDRRLRERRAERQSSPTTHDPIPQKLSLTSFDGQNGHWDCACSTYLIREGPSSLIESLPLLCLIGPCHLFLSSCKKGKGWT